MGHWGGTLGWDAKVGPWGGTLGWDAGAVVRSFLQKRCSKHFAIFTGKNLCWSLFLINESLFNKHRCSCEYCEIFKCNFFFQLERKFVKKVIILNYLNYGQQCSRVSMLTSIKPSIIGYFRNARGESLFTQGKESGTRLIITFYQLCSECENIIFDVMCWTSDHLWKCNKKMEETFEKTGKLLTKEVS